MFQKSQNATPTRRARASLFDSKFPARSSRRFRIATRAGFGLQSSSAPSIRAPLPFGSDLFRLRIFWALSVRAPATLGRPLSSQPFGPEWPVSLIWSSSLIYLSSSFANLPCLCLSAPNRRNRMFQNIAAFPFPPSADKA